MRCELVLCFLLVIFGLVQVNQAGNNTMSIHWVLIHYHKTGHELSFKLMSKLKTKCKLDEKIGPKRVAIFPAEHNQPAVHSFHDAFPLDFLLKKDIIHAVPGPMVLNWTSSFYFSPFHSYRIIHFIRDPFETIMSGFLYHIQSPSPPSESWLHWPDMSFCPNDKNFVSRAANVLGQYHPNKNIVKQWLDHAMEDCFHLQDHVHSFHDNSYLSMLRRARTHHHNYSAIRMNIDQSRNVSTDIVNQQKLPLGIRIEAYRTLFGPTKYMGGDLLSMSINVAQQPSELVRSFYLEDFAFGDKDKFRETSNQMFRFLYEPISPLKVGSSHIGSKLSPSQISEVIKSIKSNGNVPKQKPHRFLRTENSQLPQPRHYEQTTNVLSCRLCRCLSVKEAVDAAVTEAFVHNTSAVTKHITQGMQSKDERLANKKMLASDEVLGPLLTFLADLMLGYHENNRRFHEKVPSSLL